MMIRSGHSAAILVIAGLLAITGCKPAQPPGFRGDPDALVLDIDSGGVMKADGKILFTPSAPLDTTALSTLFKSRRQQERFQEIPGRDDLVTYFVVLRAANDTPFQHLQLAVLMAARDGGVTRIRFVDGDPDSPRDLALMLPKSRGLAAMSEPVTLRVILCSGGDVKAHRANRADHDKAAKDRSTTHAMVENIDCGRLLLAGTAPDKRDANGAACGAIAARIRGLLSEAASSSRRPSLLFDADSEVPFEHIMGLLAACKAKGIDSVEFAANPRLDSLFAGGRPLSLPFILVDEEVER